VVALTLAVRGGRLILDHLTRDQRLPHHSGMDRRRFVLTSLAGALAAPLAAEAQPAGKSPRIGVINEMAAGHLFVEAFRQGLREVGYVEGQNIVVEYRHVQGRIDQVPALAGELVRAKVDVLLVAGSAAARSAKAVTTTVPIVFATAGDPVSSGLVASLARPGGNATGLSVLTPDLGAKQLELLKATVPRVHRVGLLYNPENPSARDQLSVARNAARTLGLELQPAEIRQAAELTEAFTRLAAGRATAVVALGDPILGNAIDRISKLAATHRLPAIYVRREFAEAGGLLAYGPSFVDNYRRAATYVDKILKGAKPADLPIEQPTKFELVINLKTAKALGLTLPPSLLARADQLIE
jgi:putative ABC transport system substrate-binding protein